MKFRLIDANKADMPVDRVCTLLDVSVSGYYAWKKRAPSQRQLDDFVLLAHIRAQFALSNETYGAPRMHVEIREDGVQAGRHRIARLMRANGLKATQRRRFRKTTDSHHGCPVAANILDQNFACDGQDQKWGVDISYIWTAEGWLYLATRRAGAGAAGRARSLLPAHHRLGRQRPVKEGSRAECVAPCNHNPPAIRRTDPSFRPGQPILFRGLSETSGLPGNHRIHERP